METALGPYVDDHSTSSRNLAQTTSRSSNVVTLEPYSSPSSDSNNSRRPRFRRSINNLDNKNHEITPGNFEHSNYSKFLILKTKNGRQMRDCDMFAVHREIVANCQQEPKITFLNDGGLLVEVSSFDDSAKILSIPSLSGNDVDCMPHKKLNQVRGVIRSFELLRYSEEKFQNEFADQGVVEVKQMKKSVGGVLTPLPTYVLTFDRLKLPTIIRAAWLRLEVRQYIPSVRRCFYCQRFGHVISSCRKRMKGEKGICTKCGKEEHGECVNPPHCVNCGEAHPAASKKCNKFLFEKEVQALRAREHLNFKEARQRVSSTYIRPGTTFSSLFAKTPTNVNNTSVNISTQVSNKSKASVSSNTDSRDTTKTKPSNTKRKLSGDKEENPSSKIHLSNPFDLLQDEMYLENSVSVSAPPMNQVGPSLSACSVGQVEIPVSSCFSGQSGTSLSACGMDQDESFASACSSEQVGSCNLVPRTKTKSLESPKIVDQSEASSLDDTLELDSKVSATSGQAEQLPTLITKAVTEKENSTGARQKTANRKLKVPTRIPSLVASSNKSPLSELKKQENDNRKLKIPIKTSSPKASNKNSKTAISTRKTNESSKTN